MEWEELLQALQKCVPAGKVTTYGLLSSFAFGHRNAAQAIVAMLNAAVDDDYENRIWTNRVVNRHGRIAARNEAREQLTAEGIPLLSNGNVDLTHCLPIDIASCMNESPPPPKSPIPDIDEEIKAKLAWLKFSPGESRQTYTWTGFDSAWAGVKPGAIAWMSGDSDGLHFHYSKQANFDDCLTHVKNITSDMHLLMIDQPTIVENDTGFRPVEQAVSHEMGRACSGAQPANRGKKKMFGDNAPIWPFLWELKKRGFQESTQDSWGADDGNYYLETYPAFGNLGLFGYEICPKYNPERQTFKGDDWTMLCRHIGQVGLALHIEGLEEWAEKMLLIPTPETKPTKTDQDYIDAVLCMLFGYIWWRSGKEYSVVIGDNKTGYMVIPCLRPGLRETLRNDAELHNVPIDALFPDAAATGNNVEEESISENPPETTAGDNKPEETEEIEDKDPEGNPKGQKKGFIAWLIRIFHRSSD